MKASGRYVPPGYIPAPHADTQDSVSSPLTAEGAFVVGQQSSPHHPQYWTSGICACCDDMNSCCLGLCCPCVIFGRNVEQLEGRPWIGPCLMHFLLWGVITGICCVLTEGTPLGLLGSCVPCYACGYRRTVRAKYNLENAPCGDLLTHLCCHPCALCQEYREICERSTTVGLPIVIAPPGQTMDGHPVSAAD